MKTDIPIHAKVVCSDGEAGICEAIVVDSAQRRVTHLVVREHRLPHSERLVSINLVGESSEGSLRLRCTQHELHSLDNFIEAHFADLDSVIPPDYGPMYGWTFSYPRAVVTSERVPKGECAIRRSSIVEATDGPAGHVESLVVDTDDDRITHVVVRLHHFLSRREVALPVAKVERFLSDAVLLRISRRDVENLHQAPPDERDGAATMTSTPSSYDLGIAAEMDDGRVVLEHGAGEVLHTDHAKEGSVSHQMQQ